MAKKKTEKKEKNITLDELAIMVNNGFQSMHDEMDKLFQEVNDRIGDVESGVEILKEEVHYGLKKVDGSIERVGRRLNHHEEEIIKVKNRVKVVERELNIESPR